MKNQQIDQIIISGKYPTASFCHNIISLRKFWLQLWYISNSMQPRKFHIQCSSLNETTGALWPIFKVFAIRIRCIRKHTFDRLVRSPFVCPEVKRHNITRIKDTTSFIHDMSCQICLVQLVHLYSAFICPYEQPMYFCFCDVSNVCHHLQSKHVRIHNPHWQCRCPKCSFTNMEGIICAMLGTGIFPILPEI